MATPSFSRSQVLNSLGGLTQTPTSAPSAQPTFVPPPKQSPSPTGLTGINGQPFTMPPVGAPSQDVAGASTQNNSGGGGGGGGYSGPIAGDSQARAAGFSDFAAYQLAQSLARERELSTQISDAYAPALAALDQAVGVVNSGAQTQIDSINRNYDTSIANADTESATLNRNTTQKQQDYNQILKSAFDQGVRVYNALNQKAIAKYGGGSSAGGAFQELANQEFYRQQGNLSQEGAKGAREFANEFANIGTYIAQKKTDLDNWKKDAIDKVQQGLRESLLSISMRKGDIEANKTKDKIAALQAAVQNVQNIQNTNAQFLQQLAATSIGQMQQTAGRAFTPTEIQAVLHQWGIPLLGTVSTTTSQGAPIIGNFTNKNEDQLAGLVNT